MYHKFFGKTAALALVLSFFLVSPALAKVTVLTGPTPIPGGDAVHKDDLTLMNEKIAVSLAVGTPAPWGVAQGGLIDAAAKKGGSWDMDRLTLTDFLPDKWSEWASTEARVTVLENSDQQAVVQAERRWREASVVTTYTLNDGDDRIHIKTVITNEGAEPLADILTGYGQWAKAGALQEPAGAEKVREGRKVMAEVKAPLTKTTFAYEEDWALGLYGPFFNHSSYEGKDLYRLHTLKPKESKTFEGWMAVLPSGDISPAIVAEAEFEKKKIGIVAGQVTAADGQAIARPAVIAEKDGRLISWTLGRDGRYELTLPAGDYEIYASALNHAPSAKQKVKVKVKVKEGAKAAEADFSGLAGPGQVTFNVTDQNGQPLAGRLAIDKGVTQAISFLGPKTLFTSLEKKGEVTAPLAPGQYSFQAAYADPFLAVPVGVEVEVASGQAAQIQIPLEVKFDLRPAGWFNADLHHHSNLLDADTPPEYLVRSQVAAGVDFTFISDHDTVGNHQEIAGFSKKAGLEFIPGLEISPSWAHFNIFPLPLGRSLGIDPAQATAAEIFAAARKAGAKVIAVNHPNIEYGYFTAKSRGTIPGGYVEGFDLFEINGLENFTKDIPMYWEYWNSGKKYYLTGGTDNHNVWRGKSGAMRAFVHVDGPPTVDGFVKNLLAGRAFISQGPLIEPELMFGSTAPAGRPLALTFNLKSVNGLKTAALIGRGEEIEARNLEGEGAEAQVVFQVEKPEKGGWFALVVTDAKDLKAWGNPVWVE